MAFVIARLYRRQKLLLLIFLILIVWLLLNSMTLPPSQTNRYGNVSSSGGFLQFLNTADPPPSSIRLSLAETAIKRYGEYRCGWKTNLGIPGVVLHNGCFGEYCPSLTCKNLLFGDDSGSVYTFAEEWQFKSPVPVKPDEDVAASAGNCTAFIANGRYRMEPPSEEERGVVVAYNLLVHKDMEQVERLIRAIYRPHNVYCIHIDTGQPDLIRNTIDAIAACLPNVYRVSQAVRIVYAGYSRLQADINCMKDQLTHKVKWDYLINLAGQAFPLKTSEEIAKILRIYNGANDIEGMYGPRVIRNRFEQGWNESDPEAEKQKISKNGEWKDPPPYNFDIIKGSVYGIFSRKFIEWMLTDEKAVALLKWSENTYSPDEHYWNTLHHTFTNRQIHPPGGYGDNPNLKPWLASYVSWWQYGGKCNGKFIRGVCIFGVRDLPTLVDRKEMFVNKLYLDYHPLALACLDDWLCYKVVCPPEFDTDYYKKLPFIIRSNATTVI